MVARTAPIATAVVAGAALLLTSCGTESDDALDQQAAAPEVAAGQPAADPAEPATAVEEAPAPAAQLPAPSGDATTPVESTAPPATEATAAESTTAPTTAPPATEATTPTSIDTSTIDFLPLHNLEVELTAGTIAPETQRPVVAGYIAQLQPLQPPADTPEGQLLAVLVELDAALAAGDLATASTLAYDAHGLSHAFASHG